MSTTKARDIVTEILKKHDLSTDYVLCNLFVEMKTSGKWKDPWIIGMTRSTLVVVTRGPTEDLTLQYHLLPLDGVRLFASCVHYKKLIVHTATNEMYEMILNPQDLSHQQVADDWEQWARAASYLQGSAVDIRESRGVRGFFKLDSKHDDPLLNPSMENMDIHPFDQNLFQKWLQNAHDEKSNPEKPSKQK